MQVKRNIKRFPSGFMFPLTDQELRILISQFAISSSGHGGRRKPPLAFTEQGVLILNQGFDRKLEELESKFDGKFRLVFDAIKELMSTHSVPRKRIVGFSPDSSD
jgi:hypothetical protein